jgi:hypothetical protein
MKISSVNTWLLVLAMSVGVSGYAAAQSPEVLNPPIKSAAKKKAKKAGAAKAKFSSGSEETKKERSARLSRECKGQVNAGACAGYTR